MTSVQPQPFSHRSLSEHSPLPTLAVLIAPYLYARPSTCLESLPLSSFRSLPKSIPHKAKPDSAYSDIFLPFRNAVFSMANNVCANIWNAEYFSINHYFHNKVINSRRSNLTIFFLDFFKPSKFLGTQRNPDK